MEMTLSSSLLAFRLAYLEMISKAWDEEKGNVVDLQKENAESRAPSVKWEPKSDYVKELLECKDLLKHRGFTDFLAKNKNDSRIQLDWPAQVRMMNQKEGPFWAPDHQKAQKICGWVGPFDEFEIQIPKAPLPEQQGRALAAYYKIFPTLLGGGDASPVGGNKGVSQSSGDNSLGIGGPESLLGFGALALNLIAEAWESEENLEKFISGENHRVEPEQTLFGKTYQFQNPWGFDLKFTQGEAEWGRDQDGTETWVVLPKNVIWLNFPKPPATDGSNATALAAYNNSGPAYPYSCI